MVKHKAEKARNRIKHIRLTYTRDHIKEPNKDISGLRQGKEKEGTKYKKDKCKNQVQLVSG